MLITVHVFPQSSHERSRRERSRSRSPDRDRRRSRHHSRDSDLPYTVCVKLSARVVHVATVCMQTPVATKNTLAALVPIPSRASRSGHASACKPYSTLKGNSYSTVSAMKWRSSGNAGAPSCCIHCWHVSKTLAKILVLKTTISVSLLVYGRMMWLCKFKCALQ